MFKIIKNYLYTFGYQLFAIVVPLATSPYITRELGANQFGTSSFIIANMQYFVMIATLGITTYGQRSIAYVRNDKKKRSKIFYEIELLSIILTIITTILFSIYVYYFGRQLWLEYSVSYFSILACCLDISWFFMGLENFKVIVVRNMIIKILTILLVFTIVRGKYSLILYLLIVSLSTLLGNLTLWPYLKAELIRVKLKTLSPLYHFKYTLGLFLPQISSTIYIILNKIILGYICSRTETGYFDNSDKIVKMSLTVITSIATVVMPQAAAAYANNDIDKINSFLKKSIDFVLLCSFPMMFGLMAISIPFSTWFFGKQYSAVGPVLLIEAIAILPIGCSVIIAQQYLVPTKKVRIYTLSTVIGAIVNMSICWYLDIHFQAVGTAIATVITEVLVTIIDLYFIRNNVRISNLFNDIWKFLISSIVMFIILQLLICRINFNIFTLILLMVLGILIYIICIFITKPEILENIKILLSRFNR
ncbi:hypothetical protein HF82_03380 [Limosilactobacillus reuteri]|uniref:oligosaccharide flippase family protein n=1 Tax=Limosilactobacillus reuteri TaxID=1598 RepID=UPI0004D89678|nr:polysaccharide biosynthesis C-terminal domain-containing protein [Limosilactobacillus reuteri]KEQ21328.1 hypothetical protein HF82_03380 [Limosilactobacillus reuteri]MCC4456389.1 polysaccharide biosynthesis C-terminal domain-containing protein [Limosilactobacillus reuteri]MCC4465124.1 polysaccharide biosynthesis C-terminal domain-containing protein [Limosilactobacillus reuteri]